MSERKHKMLERRITLVGVHGGRVADMLDRIETEHIVVEGARDGQQTDVLRDILVRRLLLLQAGHQTLQQPVQLGPLVRLGHCAWHEDLHPQTQTQTQTHSHQM